MKSTQTRYLVEALAALAPGGLILGLERREGPQRQRVPVGQRLGEARRLGRYKGDIGRYRGDIREIWVAVWPGARPGLGFGFGLRSGSGSENRIRVSWGDVWGDIGEI